jgi:hypothetical protein
MCCSQFHVFICNILYSFLANYISNRPCKLFFVGRRPLMDHKPNSFQIWVSSVLFLLYWVFVIYKSVLLYFDSLDLSLHLIMT